ncbi:ArsR/SmtB family transcription factor [Streptomyces gobiensis]|uniref:ArsR/SmtB family transcription factor n=1 Tax=Streptomyces gobiensis TaxID=2875706 RepID=UPI001E4D421B|nr:helix-turn-helix domain-containing protein [Streptomyces gobiensis]UGY91306.1 helix-turn-helix domain-containing protein [Streptomyces gobiensis]
MLRIHFASEDLNRLRLAAGPDPLWETVLSLHLLQNRDASLVFDPWRREVRARIARAGLTRSVESLIRLAPCASYFPDFLTPGQGIQDLETGLDQLMSTSRSRLTAELSMIFPKGPLPPGARRIAEGDPVALARLAEALRRYYAIAVEPYLDAVRERFAADRAKRAAAVLSGGPEALLSSYAPLLDWQGGALGLGQLEAAYPVARDMRLKDRPLTLIPSFFCVHTPIALVDESLDPVLVHPLDPPPGWLARTTRRQEEELASAPVGQLIGNTRAHLLELLDRPLTTSQLAGSLRMAASTASRHTTVLREAGLIASRRRGNSVQHTLTPLGKALLAGRIPANEWPRSG